MSEDVLKTDSNSTAILSRTTSISSLTSEVSESQQDQLYVIEDNQDPSMNTQKRIMNAIENLVRINYNIKKSRDRGKAATQKSLETMGICIKDLKALCLYRDEENCQLQERVQQLEEARILNIKEIVEVTLKTAENSLSIREVLEDNKERNKVDRILKTKVQELIDKASKNYKEETKLHEKVTELMEAVEKTSEGNKEIIGNLKEVVTKAEKTYSNAVKFGATRVEKEQKQRTLMLQPVTEDFDPRALRRNLSDLNCPRSIKINSIRTHGRGIDIRCSGENLEELKATLEQCEQLRGKTKLIEKGPRMTRVIIFNVPLEQEKDVKEALCQEAKICANEIQVQRTLKTGGPRQHWIMDVPGREAAELIKKGRIIIGFNACTVRRYVIVQRCFRCQAFGHIAKECIAKRDFCAKCADNHRAEACTNTAKECINCWENNKKSGTNFDLNHETFARECQSYKMRMREQLDAEYSITKQENERRKQREQNRQEQNWLVSQQQQDKRRTVENSRRQEMQHGQKTTVSTTELNKSQQC